MSQHIKLLLITDSKRFASHQAMIGVLELALQGGVDTILLREKSLDSAKLLALASKVRILTHQYDAKLLIHSQADIAQAVAADGVHVDASSIAEITTMKHWLNANNSDPIKLVSASCHNAQELEQAQSLGADFAFLSPVFPTESHPGAPSLGAKKFLELSEKLNIPIIALGGIDEHSKHHLNGAGLATMGSILNAKDPKAAAKSLL
ncbi:MAG: thiamine phosphate synthase [Ghiorsea sp.]